MMNGTLFFRLLLIVSTALASHTMLMAQESFKVLAVRGAVTIGKSDQLKVGQQLKAADQIKIGASAYVSLAHKNGKTVELRKAGLYKVKDLDASASQQTGSATSKYAKYVVAQLTEVDEPIEFRDARRSHMRTTGSVDRAAGTGGEGRSISVSRRSPCSDHAKAYAPSCRQRCVCVASITEDLVLQGRHR
jgi:hypothetical protein